MPGEIEIRSLDLCDLELLKGVGDGVFDGDIRPDQARAFLTSDLHHIVVAVSDGEVIGMASAVILLHPDKAPMLFVNEVGVYDCHLRRGFGKQLVEALLDIANEQGVNDIWLASKEGNSAARGLYRSLKARETKGIVVYDWGNAMDD